MMVICSVLICTMSDKDRLDHQIEGIVFGVKLYSLRKDVGRNRAVFFGISGELSITYLILTG